MLSTNATPLLAGISNMQSLLLWFSGPLKVGLDRFSEYRLELLASSKSGTQLDLHSAICYSNTVKFYSCDHLFLFFLSFFILSYFDCLKTPQYFFIAQTMCSPPLLELSLCPRAQGIISHAHCMAFNRGLTLRSGKRGFQHV